ncbi:MAG: hypothetical protein L6Q95_02890 [Planctomycetes bacterium]|nr:hypothetical protein [Planctomycetota bacterium]
MAGLSVRFVGDSIAVLTRAFAGVILPVDASSEWIAGQEAHVPELEATIWLGSPCTSALVERVMRDGRAESLAAFATTLPVACDAPGGFKACSGAFVRFGRTPIAELTVDLASVTLTLPLCGAPLVLPPSRDHGGPRDQVWAAAVEDARERFLRVVTQAGLLGATCTVTGDGIDEDSIEEIRALAAAAWPREG